MLKHFGRAKAAGLLAVATASVGGVGAYAFTASNTVPAHSAGAGSAVVSGYTVKDPVNYTFDADGTHMVSVTLQLTTAASDVQVALSAAAPVHADWVDCGATAANTDLVCTFPSPVAVASGLQLTVAAVSSGTVTIGS